MMRHILQRLHTFFARRDDDYDQGGMQELLDKDFTRIHNVDTETDAQWLRLQRELSPQRSSARQVRSRLIPRLAFSATFLAAVLLGAYFYFLPRASELEIYATGRGEQKRLLLHDSSQIVLHYTSELAVQQFSPGKPRLLTLKGEAQFTVERNETPFIVSTSLAKVQVVGTEFNVRERDGTLEVSVRQGSVIVSVTREGKDSALTLTKNQRGLCFPASFPRRIADMPSPDYPGWMNGKLFLIKTPFVAACKEIEMRFDVTIRVDDSQLRSELVTGTLDAKTAESAVRSLCGLAGKRFSYEGHTYNIH